MMTNERRKAMKGEKGVSFFAFCLRSSVGAEGRGREYVAMGLRVAI